MEGVERIRVKERREESSSFVALHSTIFFPQFFMCIPIERDHLDHIILPLSSLTFLSRASIPPHESQSSP